MGVNGSPIIKITRNKRTSQRRVDVDCRNGVGDQDGKMNKERRAE